MTASGLLAKANFQHPAIKAAIPAGASEKIVTSSAKLSGNAHALDRGFQ